MRPRSAATWCVSSVALFALTAQAQWLNYPPPGTPLTKDGKPNLSAPAPKTRDGKPDLSGTWLHDATTIEDVKRIFGNRFDDDIAGSLPGMEIGTQHKYGMDILADFHPPESAMTAEGLARYKKFLADYDPGSPCSQIGGFPLYALLSEPIKIVQAPRLTIVMYEIDNTHRQIFTDGRKLPKEFDLPAYQGYSVGRWDGNTFAVETAGFNDQTVFDIMGHIHSEALRTTERFNRRDFGHMDVETTIDDPKTYVKPFTFKVPFHLLADQDIFEMYCSQNEKDAKHLKK